MIFSSVVEFPLVLFLATLVRPAPDSGEKENSGHTRIADRLLPAILGLSMAAVIVGVRRLGLKPGMLVNSLIFGYSVLWCLSFGKRRLRFALGLAALLLASATYWPVWPGPSHGA